jgi:hypothetical protein
MLRVLERPGPSVGVAAVAQDDGSATSVGQLVEDLQAFAEQPECGVCAALLPVQDGQVPQCSSLPAPVSEFPEDLK